MAKSVLRLAKEFPLNPEFRNIDTKELRELQSDSTIEFNELRKRMDEMEQDFGKRAKELYNRQVLKSEAKLTVEMYWSEKPPW